MRINKRQIVMEVNDKEVSFTVDAALHNTFVNGMTPGNKVQPSHNFVMAACDDEHKEFVRGLLAGEGGGFAAIELAGHLNAEYTPQLNITVKKPKSTPEPLPATE